MTNRLIEFANDDVGQKYRRQIAKPRTNRVGVSETRDALSEFSFANRIILKNLVTHSTTESDSICDRIDGDGGGRDDVTTANCIRVPVAPI